ncbi:MAG TPA: response regulator [Candidatus Eisenbacteria bacterium]|nr:response regulator [Candidatus Eisenbacteria bacterium]
MKKTLHILIVEDNPADAFRVIHHLRKGGIDFRSERVETREDFVRILQEDPPDVILSDHGLPSFDGFTALELVRKQHRKIPFIFVAGSNDQAMMIEIFEAGAAGYVYKNQIGDLVPTIHRALAEVELEMKFGPGLAGQTEPASTPPSVSGATARAPLSSVAELIKLPQFFLCPDCKKVHDERGHRMELKPFFQAHPEAPLSLMLCHVCTPKPPGMRLF